MKTYAPISMRNLAFSALAVHSIYQRLKKATGAFVAVLLLTGWSGTPAIAQELPGGAYEISVRWGSASHAVTTSHEVNPGETVEVSVGDDILSLAVLSVGGSDVDLQVGVTREDSDIVTLAVNETRRGSLGTPIALRDGEGNTAYPSGVFVTVRQLIR